MKDTSKPVLDRWQEGLDALSPQDRLEMACSMFEFARDLVADSIRNQEPEITDKELGRRVLIRFYGEDLVRGLCGDDF